MSNIAISLARLQAILSASTTLLDSARRVSDAIQRATLQGRDLTEQELDSLAGLDNLEREKLQHAIDESKSGHDA